VSVKNENYNKKKQKTKTNKKNKTKGHKQNNQNLLRSPVFEGGDPLL
jgi:hypothetical protein